MPRCSCNRQREMGGKWIIFEMNGYLSRDVVFVQEIVHLSMNLSLLDANSSEWIEGIWKKESEKKPALHKYFFFFFFFFFFYHYFSVLFPRHLFFFCICLLFSLSPNILIYGYLLACIHFNIIYFLQNRDGVDEKKTHLFEPRQARDYFWTGINSFFFFFSFFSFFFSPSYLPHSPLSKQSITTKVTCYQEIGSRNLIFG